jgi:hypothetical protein
MPAWRERHGRLPSSYAWSRTHARWRGEGALRRLEVHAVSPRVNNVRNQDADLTEPLTA